MDARLWCRVPFPSGDAYTYTCLNHDGRDSDRPNDKTPSSAAAWLTDDAWPGSVGSIIVTPASRHVTAGLPIIIAPLWEMHPWSNPNGGPWLASSPVWMTQDSRCRERGSAQRRFNWDPCPELGGADDVTRLARRSSRSLWDGHGMEVNGVWSEWDASLFARASRRLAGVAPKLQA